MDPGALDHLAASGAALVAGAVNALAGGGTLVSFPTLVALGVPSTNANITNTVALVPGYLSGAYAQRRDLASILGRSKPLLAAGAVGGLGGSILLVITSDKAFSALVPFLILLACALLWFQDAIRARVAAEADPASTTTTRAIPLGLVGAVAVASLYGGYFGAGLGVMMLAILGIFLHDSLNTLNALKSLLAFVVNMVSATFFLFSDKVEWALVPGMAVAAVIGGTIGGRLARLIEPQVLRRVVVVAGIAVAVGFWLK